MGIRGRQSGCKIIPETSLEGIARPSVVAVHQHSAFKEYKNSEGSRILACDANGSVTFQLAQIEVGPGKVPISVVLYIDGTFIKRGNSIRPVYRTKLYNMLYYMQYNMLYSNESNSL